MSPKIRLTNSVGPWFQKTIGEMFTFKNGLNKGKAFFGYGTPIVNYTDVYKHRGLTKNMVNGLVSLEADEIRRFRVKKGDVFFTRTSETPEEVGFASVLLEDIDNCSFSGFVLRGRPITNDLEIEYCKECFSVQSVRKNIVRTCTYTTRALTNGTLLSKIPIVIPPKEEQKAIASYFTSLDTLILSITKKIASLKQMKSASLTSMFPQAGETTPRVRFKGFEGEWEKKLLCDCLDISKERNIDNKYGKDDVLSVSDDFGVMNQIKLLGRSYAGKSVSNYGILEHGQLVYTKSPLKSKPYGIVKENTVETGIVSVLYAVYTAKENTWIPYIHYYFDPAWRLNAYLRPLINKGAKNTMNISDETALTGYIMIPKDINEQQRIASFFKSLDKQISLQEQRLDKIKQIKTACLDKMFV